MELHMSIRTVKPSALAHDGLWDLDQTGIPAYRAFQGLWMAADRMGRFEWRPRILGPRILPYWQGDFAEVLEALEGAGFVVSYQVDGDPKRYGWIPSFLDHQRPNTNEPASVIPPHPADPRPVDRWTPNDERGRPRSNAVRPCQTASDDVSGASTQSPPTPGGAPNGASRPPKRGETGRDPGEAARDSEAEGPAPKPAKSGDARPVRPCQTASDGVRRGQTASDFVRMERERERETEREHPPADARAHTCEARDPQPPPAPDPADHGEGLHCSNPTEPRTPVDDDGLWARFDPSRTHEYVDALRAAFGRGAPSPGFTYAAPLARKLFEFCQGDSPEVRKARISSLVAWRRREFAPKDAIRDLLNGDWSEIPEPENTARNREKVAYAVAAADRCHRIGIAVSDYVKSNLPPDYRPPPRDTSAVSRPVPAATRPENPKPVPPYREASSGPSTARERGRDPTRLGALFPELLAFRPTHVRPWHGRAVSDTERERYRAGKLTEAEAEYVREALDHFTEAAKAIQHDRTTFAAVLWAAATADPKLAVDVRIALDAWGWPPDVPVPKAHADRRRFVEAYGTEGFRYLIQKARAA